MVGECSTSPKVSNIIMKSDLTAAPEKKNQWEQYNELSCASINQQMHFFLYRHKTRHHSVVFNKLNSKTIGIASSELVIKCACGWHDIVKNRNNLWIERNSLGIDRINYRKVRCKSTPALKACLRFFRVRLIHSHQNCKAIEILVVI